MRGLNSVRMWASIGVLVLAAGMPYCSAALGWAATQDETSITVRVDVALGVLVSWIGWTILAIAGVLWGWKTFRRRRSAAAAWPHGASRASDTPTA
jgi:Na+/melibiose symporter-like transporter